MAQPIIRADLREKPRRPLNSNVEIYCLEVSVLIPKSDLLKYLIDGTTRWVIYFNHKETIAWTAVAFDCVFVTQLIAVLKPFSKDAIILAGAFILVLWGTTIFFLKRQFELRQFANDAVSAFYALSIECLNMNQDKIDALDCGLKGFSAFKSGDKQGTFILPRFVLEKVHEFRDGGSRASIFQFETVAYVLVTMAMVIAFLWMYAYRTALATQ